MKINNDVERIGDLTTTIAHKAVIIIRQEPTEIPAKINDISKEIQKMLKEVSDSLMEANAEKALTICATDRLVDEMYVETFRLILGFMIENKLSVKAGIELILSIKNFERIADHITNIAEDIVYVAKGESIKHKKEI
jgi:phosphate transport system protein